MANQEQLEILKQGVEAWNEWRDTNPGIRPNLIEANLSDRNLQGANLNEVVLIRAKLDNADLSGATLDGAELSGAKLLGARFIGTHLSNCIFDGSYLANANFDRATMRRAKFDNVDLSQTKNLETIVHYGPSYISVDTLFASKGKIPEAFLKGCGFDDYQIQLVRLAEPGLDRNEITNIAYDLVNIYCGSGIKYSSCFISYNNSDEMFTKKLHDDMQNNGVRCWFALNDLKIGDKIRPRIDQEIRFRDKLLVVLSKNSIKSEWVGDEVEAALEEEKVGDRLVLFPIRLDDAVLDTRDDWAAKIKRRRHIGDFSNWKNEVSYQKAFERLLRDLKAPDDARD